MHKATIGRANSQRQKQVKSQKINRGTSKKMQKAAESPKRKAQGGEENIRNPEAESNGPNGDKSETKKLQESTVP